MFNLIFVIECFFNKQKGDQTDATLNIGNFVFDNENHERKSWKIFGHSCTRYLVVFLSQFVVNLSIVACSIVRITLFKTCKESKTWVPFLSSTVVIFYLPRNNEKSNINKRLYFNLLSGIKPNRKVRTDF